MKDYKVITEIQLTELHKPTGQTHHYWGQKELPPPKRLQIVRFTDDPGVCLLYLDDKGEWLTDTYHDSIELAMDQANWEFNIGPGEWPHTK